MGTYIKHAGIKFAAIVIAVCLFFLMVLFLVSNTSSNDYYQDYRSKVNGITVIPTTGIGAYSNQVIHQLNYLESSTWPNDPDIGKVYWSTTFNDQYANGTPNLAASTNQLQAQLPNTEWVALTVGWFLDFDTLTVAPMVEKKEEVEYVAITVHERNEEDEVEEVVYERSIRKNVLIDQEAYMTNVIDGAVTGTPQRYWSVGSYTRDTAELIDPSIYYGETPSDQEVLEAVSFYKSQGYKVMIYPFLLGYRSDKPWRGRLTLPSVPEVNSFMTKTSGYNAFIKHYIDLLQNENIDGFLVGSEMEGLTFSAAPYYPAVDHFINLIQYAKSSFPSSVKVSYAANWSEYHHDPATGIYHLDPLWNEADFVGIDAYFPLTEKHSTDYEEIYDGWESGEYYDYYYNAPDYNTRHNLAPEYAIKNIRYWWENKHFNPGNVQTSWVPKSKKIWFTELGFASVNATTVQPNIFVDSTSSEGGYPRGSTQETSFTTQAVALNASLDYLNAQEWIDNVFIWTWDTRPYPTFPFSNLWIDGINWEQGHWLNGKDIP